MKNEERYKHLNKYLKEKFGERTLKICIDGGFTCPNRDGSKGYGGCTFCSDSGSGEFAGTVMFSAPLRFQILQETCREIARNGIVAMAAALVAEDHPGTTVVTDSITSRQLTAFIEDKLGLKHLRFKRGYKNVINKSKELNEQGIDSQLAIETSGHAALKENYFLDDGAYLAVKIVIKAARLKAEGKTLDSLIEDKTQKVFYIY